MQVPPSPSSPLQLRLGRWQDTLGAGELFDVLISDPPYSATTHNGHNSAEDSADACMRRGISYAWFTPADVEEFVVTLSPCVRGWFVIFTDDELAPVWKAELWRSGRYVFAPLPFVERGSRVRRRGDGPSCWTNWIIVARPRNREFAGWGTLDGAYVAPPGTRERIKVPGLGRSLVGHKSQWVMRSLVRDYSSPGDCIIDPCAGGGSTLIAAEAEGRMAVGIEMDEQSYEVARWRLERIEHADQSGVRGGALPGPECVGGGEQHQTG